MQTVSRELIGSDDRRRLLQLARSALEARVRGTAAPAPERGGALDERLGAFVTIHVRGELRGCLGRLSLEGPLSETIAHLGAVVADSDPRFPAVTPGELPDLTLEISVLAPEQGIASAEEVLVGRHGIIVEDGHRRGLLLPQVAVEHGWDRETFLAHTCLKAGLPRDAWRRGATVSVFEADVFAEPGPV